MTVNKKDVVRLLEEIAIYLELKGENPFKIAAYRRAAQSLETDERALDEIDDVTKIKGIGKGTGAVINEFIAEGKSSELEKLKEEVPAGLIPLLQLPGLGGKRLSRLYKELDIVDADSLKKACEEGKVEQLSGFGPKTSVGRSRKATRAPFDCHDASRCGKNRKVFGKYGIHPTVFPRRQFTTYA